MELTKRIKELEERLRFLELENQQLQNNIAHANPLDVTAIKEKEIELMNSEARYKALSNATNEAVWFSVDSLCVDFNRSALKMFGYSAKEVFGIHALSIIDKAYRAETIRHLKENYLEPYFSMGLHKDGHSFPIQIQGRVFDYNGKKTRITTMRDISEEKEKELALLESKAQLALINQHLELKVKEELVKSREKDHLIIQQSRHVVLGEMIGNIAHQWRQPLNDISVLINDLEDAFGFGVLTKDYFNNTIEIVFRRLKFMSDTINDFSIMHTDDFKKETFQPKVLIEKLIRFAAGLISKNNIQIQLVCHKDFEVYGYPNMLSHVMLNLLNNSHDILVERNIKKPKIWIKVKQKADHFSIQILDNGKGVEMELIDKIFDPYFTNKGLRKGSGLGLYMVKSIVEKQMHGQIELKNQPEGAEFKITLDLKIKDL